MFSLDINAPRDECFILIAGLSIQDSRDATATRIEKWRRYDNFTRKIICSAAGLDNCRHWMHYDAEQQAQIVETIKTLVRYSQEIVKKYEALRASA